MARLSATAPGARSGTADLGGTFALGGELPVTRTGYGTMQLAGPGVWGPPKDHGTAVAVLREAVDRGVTHLDTSGYYGPHTANALIKEALHPHPEPLGIVTKAGARRRQGPAADLTEAVHDNLRNLGVDALDVVNLRLGSSTKPRRSRPSSACRTSTTWPTA